MSARISFLACASLFVAGCKLLSPAQTELKADEPAAGAQLVSVTLDPSGKVVTDGSAPVQSPRFLAVYVDQAQAFSLKTFYPDAKSAQAVHGSVDDALRFHAGKLEVFDHEKCHIDALQTASDLQKAREDLAGIDCLKVERESGDPSYVIVALMPSPSLNLTGDQYDHHLAVKMYAEAFGGAGNGGDLVIGPTVDRESDCRFGVGFAGGLSAQVYGMCSYTWQSSQSTAFRSVTFTKIGVQASIFDIPALPLYAVMISTDEGTRVRGPFNCGSIIGAMAFGEAMTASTTWDCNETAGNRAVKTILWNEYL